MARTKSMADIISQAARLQKTLYHSNNGDRYRRVSAITSRYLNNISRRQGTRSFVDNFNNSTNFVGNMGKQYSRSAYANAVG